MKEVTNKFKKEKQKERKNIKKERKEERKKERINVTMKNIKQEIM